MQRVSVIAPAWSASATLSNDEFLIVLRSPRIAKQYNDYFAYLWDSGRHMGEAWLIDEGDAEGELRTAFSRG